MSHESIILIVDDQRLAQKSLQALLKPEYQLAYANNGAEALSLAIKLIPDVVLLDIVMPDMDGFEVCRRLRAHPLLAEVPIIMLTALDDRDSRLRGLEAGADDFVSKPFDAIELRARVRSIIRLNRYRRLLVERVRFRWVVEHAEEGYLIVDAADTVLYANPKARLYLDLPETTLEKGAAFLDLARRCYQFQPQDAWLNWPESTLGETRRYLVRPETPTARAFWIEVARLQLPAGPDMAGMIRLRDVTAAMATLRDMRSFHAAVTHKLRTPISHIVGNLELLKRFYQAQITAPDVAELFADALKGGRRLSQEVEEVLRYAHDLPVLAQEGEACALAQLPLTVELMNLELELQSAQVSIIDCPANTRVALTERAMELTLWEILENAKKFHPQHSPQVEIIATVPSSQKLCLRIMDDGLTLSPEQLAQIWTPYYQGEKQFTGEVAGLGLGLTLVANLVWSVGGTCRMYNRTPGPGVVIELLLPQAV